MSQRGPAPRPDSQPSSRSPTLKRERLSSPSETQQNPIQRDDAAAPTPSSELVSVPVANNDGRNQANPQRTSGVHNILNPSEPREPLPGASPSLPRSSIEGGFSPARMGSSSSAGDSPSHSHLNPTASHSARPPLGVPSAASGPLGLAPATTPAPWERGAPPANVQYPPMGAARRILNARSPRSSSLNRAAPSFESHSQAFPRRPPRAAVPPHDLSPLSGPPPFVVPNTQSPFQASAMQPLAGPSPGTPRSLSQPGGDYVFGQSHPREAGQGGNSRLDMGGRQASFQGNAPFTSSGPISRPPGAPGPVGEAVWGPEFMAAARAAQANSGARGLAMSESQPMLAITPRDGEEILVHVDVHQASRQADEKRQRNAGASARFRLRKKEKEKEKDNDMQRLESSNRELERRNHQIERQNQELAVERDFYRNERNRLREIIAQTPSISDLARGPPSPTFSRSGGSFASDFTSDNSPLAAQPPQLALAQTPQALQAGHPYPPAHAHPPPTSYPTSDPSMLERPARRRRTEPGAQFTTPSYGPPPPPTLPPITGSSLGHSPSPHPLTSPGLPRLPPLRLEHPSPTGSDHTSISVPAASLPPPAQTPQGQPQYFSYSRPPHHDSGWATGPRTPHEGGM